MGNYAAPGPSSLIESGVDRHACCASWDWSTPRISRSAAIRPSASRTSRFVAPRHGRCPPAASCHSSRVTTWVCSSRSSSRWNFQDHAPTNRPP